jgi:hypothetical protein
MFYHFNQIYTISCASATKGTKNIHYWESFKSNTKDNRGYNEDNVLYRHHGHGQTNIKKRKHVAYFTLQCQWNLDQWMSQKIDQWMSADASNIYVHLCESTIYSHFKNWLPIYISAGVIFRLAY